jgi:PBSX family phage terminase large subunit
MIEWSDKQKSFFANSYHSFNILSGAVSSGKTFISNLRWYKHICDAPNNSLLVMIGKTAESLRDNCIKWIMDMDNGITLDETKVPMRLYCSHNNVEVACAGGDNERSWQRIQGKTTAGAYFDEVTNLPQTLVQNIAKGCRHEGKQWPKFMTCNPDAPSHYIKKQYIDNSEIDKRVWYFGLPDNPSLTKEYIAEVKQLYTGALYDRMILGKWVQAEGVVFNEFDRDRHLFTEIKNTIKEYIIAIDWGYTNPLAILYIAVDYDNNYYVLDEFYETKQLIDQSLKNKLTKKGWFQNRISYGYADTNRPDCISSMNNLIPPSIVGAKKDVNDGINAVNKQFKTNKLFIHANKCQNTLKELESYVWMKKKGNETDDPIKENDHLMDALRYAIFTREKSRVRMIKRDPFKR